MLSLTAAHVAKVMRPVEDSGSPPGVSPQTDADYEAWVERMLRLHPAPDHPTQLFAYGSLIWKPEIEHVGERRQRLTAGDALSVSGCRAFAARRTSRD